MKRLISTELRALWIRENWFTCGSIKQYSRFFLRNEEGDSPEELATIIWICSDQILYSDIYKILCREMQLKEK